MPGAGVLGVHHTRKMHSDDWLDQVSGTNGLTGAADYILMLQRERKSDEAVLHVTGRDIREGGYALTFDDGIWTLDGMDLLDASERADERTERGNLGGAMLAVMAYVNGRDEPATTADVVAQYGETLGIYREKARVYLNRLADEGRIQKVARGQYFSAHKVFPVMSVTNSEDGTRERNTNNREHPGGNQDIGKADPICACGNRLIGGEAVGRGTCKPCHIE